ncbi:MAG: hypothetical protein ACR2FU_01120 [Streptosporangiaceae bacterium]
MRAGVLAAYAVPAIAVWALLGLVLTALPLRWLALPVAVAYGAYYGSLELTGRRGLPVPGRSWQVPQSMLIDAPPRRRLLVWGALLGPGFVTRNPYAGFGLLPVAVAAMPGPAAGVALAAAIGFAHGTARAAGLLRDVRELRAELVLGPAAAGPDPLTGHLDTLLKTVYWRRADGAVLVAAAALAAGASLQYLT